MKSYTLQSVYIQVELLHSKVALFKAYIYIYTSCCIKKRHSFKVQTYKSSCWLVTALDFCMGIIATIPRFALSLQQADTSHSSYRPSLVRQQLSDPISLLIQVHNDI